MDHVVFYSGGSGSYEATCRVLESGVNPDSLHLMFTDTLIEHRDLYKFLLQTFQKFYGVCLTSELKMVEKLPEVYENDMLRYQMLEEIATEVMGKCPNVHWIHYKHKGNFVHPWYIFYNQEFIGNSRIAPCSAIIKQRLAMVYLTSNWPKENVSVYFGIDWSEEHRKVAPIKHWSPYVSAVNFPLMDPPYTTPDQRRSRMVEDGIDVPKLYQLGFAHNNCGGFCVRAGQGHFKQLYEKLPRVFEYHRDKETQLARDLVSKTGNKYSILTRQVKGVKIPLPLMELQQMVDGGGDIDIYDLGGCGCFVSDSLNDTDLSEDPKFSFKDLKVYKGVNVYETNNN